MDILLLWYSLVHLIVKFSRNANEIYSLMISNETKVSDAPTVVSTQWLNERIEDKAVLTKQVRILDASFIKDKSVDTYSKYYLKEHIPEATFFDLHRCVNSTTELPRNLPEDTCFTDYVRSLGIWSNTHVIVYTRFIAYDAFRTWWLFRLLGHRNISVLDGGLKKWKADGLSVTNTTLPDSPTPQTPDFTVTFNRTLFHDFSDMLNIVRTKSKQVIDARATDEKWVVSKELDSGIILGAKFVSYPLLLNSDGTMKSKGELKSIFEEGDVNITLPMVVYCNSGMKATIVSGAGHILGEDIPVYSGSWTEWRLRAPEDLKQRFVT